MEEEDPAPTGMVKLQERVDRLIDEFLECKREMREYKAKLAKFEELVELVRDEVAAIGCRQFELEVILGVRDESIMGIDDESVDDASR